MKHYYQPDQFTCVQTACAILLSHYGIEKTPEQIVKEVPTRSWPDRPDDIAGTPSQDIARYLVTLGFDVTLISFDVWVTDLGWIGKDTPFIRERLSTAKGKLTAPNIGRSGTDLYIQCYLDFIDAGGKIEIAVAPSSSQIKSLLEDGPFMCCVSYNTLHGAGKSISQNDRSWVDDDIKGTAPNHNVTLSRWLDNKIEVYDPWRGVLTVDPERLVAAIATAQMECDNMLIVARKSDGK